MRRLIALGAGLLAVVLAGAGVGGAAPSFGETGPEFVDLPYLEESSGTSTLGECDAPEPGVLVCGLTYEGELVSTLIGHATEILHGTTLLRTGESCVLSTGATGALVLADLSDGTMFTADGSEIYFRATFE